MAMNLISDLVAPSQSLRMCQTNVTDLGRPVWFVDTSDPRITPPVGKQVRIVEAKDVDVRPVHEVVRQNADVAARVVRSDDTDERWIVAFQRRDELLRPVAGQHQRVVVDAVEVVDVVEVSFEHRVVLSPGRLTCVVAPDEGQVSGGDAAVFAWSRRRCFVKLSVESIAQPLVGKHAIAAVVRQIKPIDEALIGRTTERRQKCGEELKLLSDIVFEYICELPRCDPTPYGDNQFPIWGLLNRTVDAQAKVGKELYAAPRRRLGSVSSDRHKDRNQNTLFPEAFVSEAIQNSVTSDQQ